MRLRSILLIALAVMAVSSVAAVAGHHEEKAKKRYYPVQVCPVSGEELDSDAMVLDIDGREYRVCCAGCKKKVLADPNMWTRKLDEQIIREQDKSYPLDTCPISGSKLGSMGEPVKIVLDNYLIKLCCAGCEKSIRKDPDATLDKLAKFWNDKHFEDAMDHVMDGLHEESMADCDHCKPGRPCAMHAPKGCAGCKDGQMCDKCAAKKSDTDCAACKEADGMCARCKARHEGHGH